MKVLKYRYSTVEDWGIIFDLLKLCFGFIHPDWNGNLDGRYFMAFDDDKLVAVTGVNSTGIYKGLEVDWTCVLPEYRGHNIMTIMLKHLLDSATEDVYCSCWRVLNNPINLHKAMYQCGFEQVQEGRHVYSKQWYYACDDCIYHNVVNCRCCEDLYVKHYDKTE